VTALHFPDKVIPCTGCDVTPNWLYNSGKAYLRTKHISRLKEACLNRT